MRAGTIAGLVVLALAAGIGGGELMYRSQICRDAIGRYFGKGRLMALVSGHGIYESDLSAERATDQYLTGGKADGDTDDVVLKRLIANQNVGDASHSEAATGRGAISETKMEYELDLLRHEFVDDKLWTSRMAASGISAQSLTQRLRKNLAGRQWIDQRIENELTANDGSLRNFYTQHFAEFAQPLRLRASHIFLAAPPETLPEVVEAKQKLISSLAARLRGGEDFEALVWEESEDEASKKRGGDLRYLSQGRVPQDFFEKIAQLKIGETSKPFRSALGFHIVRVTEIKPPRQMTFEEARSEIVSRLTNQRRREGVETFVAQLGRSSALRRDWFWN